MASFDGGDPTSVPQVQPMGKSVGFWLLVAAVICDEAAGAIVLYDNWNSLPSRAIAIILFIMFCLILRLIAAIRQFGRVRELYVNSLKSQCNDTLAALLLRDMRYADASLLITVLLLFECIDQILRGR